MQALLEEGTSSTEDKLTASTDSEAQLQEEEDGQEGSEERTSPTTKRTPRAKKSPPSELLQTFLVATVISLNQVFRCNICCAHFFAYLSFQEKLEKGGTKNR